MASYISGALPSFLKIKASIWNNSLFPEIPLVISCSAHVLVTNCLRFCSFENIFISLSILKDVFAKYGILD